MKYETISIQLPTDVKRKLESVATNVAKAIQQGRYHRPSAEPDVEVSIDQVIRGLLHEVLRTLDLGIYPVEALIMDIKDALCPRRLIPV